MARTSLVVRAIYAACLAGATGVHLGIHFQFGVLLGDLAPQGCPLFTRLFWSALTLLDPLAAVLLFLRPRAGILLTQAIIVADVAHNTWILHRLNQTADWHYWCQASFGLFVLSTFRLAQPDRRREPIPT